MTDLRGKITKGSTFESDWMCEKEQYFSSLYFFKKTRIKKFLSSRIKQGYRDIMEKNTKRKNNL